MSVILKCQVDMRARELLAAYLESGERGSTEQQDPDGDYIITGRGNGDLMVEFRPAKGVNVADPVIVVNTSVPPSDRRDPS